MVKNLNWQEADKLAINKHSRGVELGTTEKQLQVAARADPKSGVLTAWPHCLAVVFECLPWFHDVCNQSRVREFVLAIQKRVAIQMNVSIITTMGVK